GGDVELDGPEELPMRKLPIPAEIKFVETEQFVPFGAGLVERQRVLCRLFEQRKSLTFIETSVGDAEKKIGARKTYIRQCKQRVTRTRLAKQNDAPSECVFFHLA